MISVTVETADAVALFFFFVFTGVVVHFHCQPTCIWKWGEMHLGVSVIQDLEDYTEKGTTLSVWAAPT